MRNRKNQGNSRQGPHCCPYQPPRQWHAVEIHRGAGRDKDTEYTPEQNS
jgi:hypothetical protein